MLGQVVGGREGWDVARDAAANAGGGATYVLQLPRYLMQQPAAQQVIPAGQERMIRDGWNVAHVDSMEEIITFARRFSQANYGQKSARKSNAT
jgi:hypothetical protein